MQTEQEQTFSKSVADQALNEKAAVDWASLLSEKSSEGEGSKEWVSSICVENECIDSKETSEALLAKRKKPTKDYNTN